MEQVELKISFKDWLYIISIGALFGLFVSLFFYFLNVQFQEISTILFGTSSAIIITLFSSIFITVSNNYILPNTHKKFWYLISFVFSFMSGALGFWTSFSIFYIFDSVITNLIEAYSLYLSFTIGCLTFLVGLILHQFIAMKYKNELIKNEILNSKIKALENELNPHFLFNALNSMSELVYIDQNKAENSILNLSKFLRNAINKKSLITIKDELSMVQTYVDIENIRFDDKIKLVVDISNNLENILIPKFSIQLLVENAIKHGYMSKELEIIIHYTNDKITVSNNGAKITKINFGTGLTNLQNRLNLLNVGRLDFEHKSEITTFIIYLGNKQ
ncbi:MAG: histidine kinase [Arcobacteraceae bacterium]